MRYQSVRRPQDREAKGTEGFGDRRAGMLRVGVPKCPETTGQAG